MDAMKRIDPRKDPEQIGTIAKQVATFKHIMPTVITMFAKCHLFDAKTAHINAHAR
jgi:hypothetical protein